MRGDIQRSVNDRIDELKKRVARAGDTAATLTQTANNFRAALALIQGMRIEDLTMMQRVVLAQRVTELRAAVQAYAPQPLPALPDLREPLITAAQSMLRDRTRQDGLLRMGDPLAKTINTEVRNMAGRVSAANPLGRFTAANGTVQEVGTQVVTALTMFGGLLRDRHHKNVQQFRDLVDAVMQTRAYHEAEAANVVAEHAHALDDACADLEARLDVTREPDVTLGDDFGR